MRKIASLAAVAFLGLGVAACTSGGQLTPAAKAQLGVACLVDGIVQPVAAATITAAVPGSAPGVSVDSLVVHPAVVKLCAQLGGTPVAAPVAAPAPAGK